MGTKGRPKPERLASKLLEIRTKMGLSQNGMIRRMGLTDKIVQAEVSAYEHGVREPPLHVLLQYARAANVIVDWLIDDEIILPDELPSAPLPPWVQPRQTSKSSRSRKGRWTE